MRISEALIRDAAIASELFGDDELEEYSRGISLRLFCGGTVSKEEKQLSEYEKSLTDNGFFLVDSSAFRACKWEDCDTDDPCGAEEGHLSIAFHQTKKEPDKPGAIWIYQEVPRGTFEAMMVATGTDSPGKFFAREIKGKKPGFKLNPEDKK